MVLSILLQSPISTGLPGKTSSVSQMPGGPAPSTSDLSGSSKSRMNPNGSSQRIVREGLSGKRKELESIKLLFPFLPCMPHTHDFKIILLNSVMFAMFILPFRVNTIDFEVCKLNNCYGSLLFPHTCSCHPFYMHKYADLCFCFVFVFSFFP